MDDSLNLAVVIGRSLHELERGDIDHFYLETFADELELERALCLARAFVAALELNLEIMRHPYRLGFAVWRAGASCPIYPEVRPA